MSIHNARNTFQIGVFYLYPYKTVTVSPQKIFKGGGYI